MDEAHGLHNLARLHCIERGYRLRIQTTQRPQVLGVPPDALPRHQVLEAILEAIERHEPDSFASFKSAQSVLLADVWSAQHEFSRPQDAAQQAAMHDERLILTRLIQSATQRQALESPPLFYRRTLSGEERLGLVARLEDRWGVRKTWFPIFSALDAPHASENFMASDFDDQFEIDSLRGILLEHGAGRVFEWREWGRSVLVDAAQVEMSYTGAEAVCCDALMQWVVYASHEDSLLLGGWLADEVKRRWPAWCDHLWRQWW